MNEKLTYIEVWKNSKSKIFVAESYVASVTEELDDPVRACYIQIDGNGLLARATIWENGSLVMSIFEIETETLVLQKSFEIVELWELDDKLNWWLSEVVPYDA